jgi:hypothetical protein
MNRSKPAPALALRPADINLTGHYWLKLYTRPLSRSEPVICIDEKSLQLIGHSRAPLPMTDQRAAKHDYEYTSHGMTALFVAVVSVPGPARGQPAGTALRSRRLAARAQRPAPNHPWKFTR